MSERDEVIASASRMMTGGLERLDNNNHVSPANSETVLLFLYLCLQII